MDKIRYTVENDVVKEIHKVAVHTFTMSGVEDPDIYAAGPIFDWERSEAGQYVMKHAIDKPEWHKFMDYDSIGYRYVIVAELEAKKLSEFYLRWGSVK
jgi:hypothetical protein